jgi:hypothetical protein
LAQPRPQRQFRRGCIEQCDHTWLHVRPGGEYQPSSWRLFGNPVSVFLQYQHTWWGAANFNTPTSSPFFNYAFKREDDTIRLGVNIHLSR